MSLPYLPLLEPKNGDLETLERNTQRIYEYLQSFIDAFPNASGQAIDPSMGQGGDGSLTITEAPSSIIYTPGSSLSVDGTIFGHIDISFVLPDRAVDLVVFYKESSVQNYKISYASSSPFRLINLKVGTVYDLKVAGQAANGSVGVHSLVQSVNIPTNALNVTAPSGFSLIPTYQSLVLQWTAPVGGVLLEYELERAEDSSFTVNPIRWDVDATHFVDDLGSIGTLRYYRVRSVDRAGSTSGWSSTLSGTTLNVPDDSILYSKIQNVSESRLLLRGQGSGAGDVQEGIVGTHLVLSGTTLSVSPSINTFTITATGFTTSVTGTARYVLLGTIVVLFIPLLTGTSNATTFTLTGLPSEIQPTQTAFDEVRATDNGIDLLSIARLNSGSGTIDLFSSIALAVWTALGTKTIHPTYLTYHRS